MPNSQLEYQPHREGEPFILKVQKYSIPSVNHNGENQDTIALSKSKAAALVCDGASGYIDSVIASTAARDFGFNIISQIPTNTPRKIAALMMEDILIATSEKVQSQTETGETTIVAVKIVEEEGEAFALIGNVGDSRAYIMRGGKLIQVSTDDDELNSPHYRPDLKLTEKQKKFIHTILDNAEDDRLFSQYPKYVRDLFERRQLVTQLLGDKNNILSPHVKIIRLQKGDRILLDSDGIHDNLTTNDIENQLMMREGEEAESLVSLAESQSQNINNIRKKPDDLSAIILDYDGINVSHSPVEDFFTSLKKQQNLSLPLLYWKLFFESLGGERLPFEYISYEQNFTRHEALQLFTTLSSQSIPDKILQEVFIA